jgi:hypothetical protein
MDANEAGPEKRVGEITIMSGEGVLVSETMKHDDMRNEVSGGMAKRRNSGTAKRKAQVDDPILRKIDGTQVGILIKMV